MQADELCTTCTHTPCTACSWTRFQQKSCDYKSHLRLFHGASRRGVWSIGSKYILKDRESEPPDYEPQNTKFLRTHTSIPVPQVVLEWDEPGDRCIRILERVEGITLKEAWPSLSDSEKRDIAQQTCKYLAQLRGFHSSQIESLDHGRMYDSFLFAGGDDVPHGPIKSDDELWDEMVGGIKTLDERAQQLARSLMPKATPYTFTHGVHYFKIHNRTNATPRELSCDNIMVKDGKVTGILDWERSGYMPRWWEYVSACRSVIGDDEDQEWKPLLREYMEAPKDHLIAAEYWSACFSLRDFSDLIPLKKEVLAAFETLAGVKRERPGGK